MEEHAGRYTTNQDNDISKHISNDPTPREVLDYSLGTFKHFTNIHGDVGIIEHLRVFYNDSNCVQLLCRPGFFTSGKSRPPFF